jgi:hypothetical protein
MIVLPGGKVSITECAKKLFALIRDALDLFLRGGQVHEIIVNPDGSQRLDPITSSQFRSRLESYARPLVWRVGANGEAVLKPTICPEETARALLDSEPARKLLPHVAALVSSPVLACIGGKMQILGPGWHSSNGGLIVTGGESPPRVPLNEAVKALCDILGDFDFQSLGDRSRALALLVAPALRFGSWLKNAIPVHIAEADASQSGKTFLQKVVAAIYGETCNVVVQKAGGVGGLDESLSQKLLDGRPFILLDNHRGRFDSPFLEAILTAPGTMPARVPHKAEVQVDTRGLVFQFTSNGVEITRDLANRASITRLRKRPPGYAFKEYFEGDLYAHVVANQPYFLGCVFSIIAEWVNKGQPRTKETRHDFREWAQVLDWIVQNIVHAAPLMDGHEDARERVSDPRRSWVRRLCIALRDAKRSGEFYASQIAEFALENDLPPPGVGPDADETVAARKIGSAMAAIFREDDEVDIDGFRIHRIHGTSPKTGNPAITYRFEQGEKAA